MRIATYNVENLFLRARALNLDTWAEGRPILEKFAELNSLIEEPSYTTLRTLDGIELRDYAAYTVAEVLVNAEAAAG